VEPIPGGTTAAERKLDTGAAADGVRIGTSTGTTTMGNSIFETVPWVSMSPTAWTQTIQATARLVQITYEFPVITDVRQVQRYPVHLKVREHTFRVECFLQRDTRSDGIWRRSDCIGFMM